MEPGEISLHLVQVGRRIHGGIEILPDQEIEFILIWMLIVTEGIIWLIWSDSWLVKIILVHRQFETEIEVHQAVPRVEQELRLDLEEHQDDKNIILIQTFAEITIRSIS